jgi:hypothetical protein
MKVGLKKNKVIFILKTASYWNLPQTSTKLLDFYFIFQNLTNLDNLDNFCKDLYILKERERKTWCIHKMLGFWGSRGPYLYYNLCFILFSFTIVLCFNECCRSVAYLICWVSLFNHSLGVNGKHGNYNVDNQPKVQSLIYKLTPKLWTLECRNKCRLARNLDVESKVMLYAWR